ncbi:MAG TPA: GTPase Era [Firmicutes bacterium]|jgi:GTP-binding protein Era|nr:GTPase Era [Bacillota bacterium]
MGFRSGFVTVIGRPNVGKSTFLNTLLGEKFLIVSDKPQTTRNRIRCILTTREAQVVFIDTPGIHQPKSLLAEGMVQAALNTLQEVDAVVFMVDATEPLEAEDRYIAAQLAKINTPIFLVLNKVDLANDRQLARLETKWQKLLPQAEAVAHTSALTGYNLDFLRQQLLAVLPEGPQYYPDDMVIDQPERFVVAELIREKILHLTHEEVPHAVAVVVDEMKEREAGHVYVRATIYVERESQKGIIIGKQGSMLKAIGESARTDIEHLLGSRTYLDIWVKTRKDWRNQQSGLRQLGYEELLQRGR